MGLPASASVSSSHGGKSRTRETPPEQRNQSDGEGKMVDGAVGVQEDGHVQVGGGVQGGRADSCVASGGRRGWSWRGS